MDLKFGHRQNLCSASVDTQDVLLGFNHSLPYGDEEEHFLSIFYLKIVFLGYELSCEVENAPSNKVSISHKSREEVTHSSVYLICYFSKIINSVKIFLEKKKKREKK